MQRMTWIPQHIPGKNVWYADRSTVMGTGVAYLLPDCAVHSIGAVVSLTTGVTGAIVQTTEGDAGTKEVQTLTVTAGTDIAGYVGVTLNSVPFAVPVGINLNDYGVAAAIRAFDFGTAWVVTGADEEVIFTAAAVGARAGDYAFDVSGTGKLEYSYSSPQEIATGNGIFQEWGGSDPLDNAITAWRVKASAGYVTAEVVVKGTF